MIEQLIKIKFINRDKAIGIDERQDQLLREASWQLNHIVVEVPGEGRETGLKFLGGHWLESTI
jgi:hypothetical protein